MVERGIARDGYRLFDLSGNAIGSVTSGSPAPFLEEEYRAGVCAAERLPTLGLRLRLRFAAIR
jgi:hypothetical protein